MKFVLRIDYAQDAEKRRAFAPQDHVYLKGLLDTGQLSAAGLLADGAGSIWVYDAYDFRPLVYWSAKAAVRST